MFAKKTRTYSDLRHAAIDALLSGAAFTPHHERLGCFADVAGEPPTREQYLHAEKYVGEFLTNAGLLNIAGVIIRPRKPKEIEISIWRIEKGKRILDRSVFTYKRKTFDNPFSAKLA